MKKRRYVDKSGEGEWKGGRKALKRMLVAHTGRYWVRNEKL